MNLQSQSAKVRFAHLSRDDLDSLAQLAYGRGGSTLSAAELNELEVAGIMPTALTHGGETSQRWIGSLEPQLLWHQRPQVGRRVGHLEAMSSKPHWGPRIKSQLLHHWTISCG